MRCCHRTGLSGVFHDPNHSGLRSSHSVVGGLYLADQQVCTFVLRDTGDALARRSCGASDGRARLTDHALASHLPYRLDWTKDSPASTGCDSGIARTALQRCVGAKPYVLVLTQWCWVYRSSGRVLAARDSDWTVPALQRDVHQASEFDSSHSTHGLHRSLHGVVRYRQPDEDSVPVLRYHRLLVARGRAAHARGPRRVPADGVHAGCNEVADAPYGFLAVCEKYNHSGYCRSGGHQLDLHHHCRDDEQYRWHWSDALRICTSRTN